MTWTLMQAVIWRGDGDGDGVHTVCARSGYSICVSGFKEITHPLMILAGNVTSVNDVSLEILAGFIFRAFNPYPANVENMASSE
jgi:hypothetical protein